MFQDREGKEKGVTLRAAQYRKGLFHLMNETINPGLLSKLTWWRHLYLSLSFLKNLVGNVTGVTFLFYKFIQLKAWDLILFQRVN